MLKGVCISLLERYDPALFHHNCISCIKEVVPVYNLKLKISFWKIFFQLAITDNETSVAETQSVYGFLFSVKYLFSIFCKFPTQFQFTKYLFSIFCKFPCKFLFSKYLFSIFCKFPCKCQITRPSLPALTPVPTTLTRFKMHSTTCTIVHSAIVH